MKKRWLGAIAILVALSLIISACAAPAPTTPAPTTPTTPTPTTPAPTTPTPTGVSYQWIMSCFLPEGYMLYDLSEDFIAQVEDASEGRITIRLFGGDLLGNPDTQMKSLTVGTQDMAVSSPSTVHSPKWDINSCWYLINDWDTHEEFFRIPDGWLYKAYVDISRECNWEYLAEAPQGRTSIISNVKFDPVPGLKDIKIRVMPSEVARLGLEAIGFSPITMAWSEIPSAMMLGTIDAAWGPTSADDFRMLSDVYEYAYVYCTNMGTNINAINLDLFNSLSPEDQAMLKRVAKEWQEHFYDVYIDYDNQMWEEVAKTNTVIQLTKEQWYANAKVARPVVWPIFEEVLGSELMDLIEENSPVYD